MKGRSPSPSPPVKYGPQQAQQQTNAKALSSSPVTASSLPKTKSPTPPQRGSVPGGVAKKPAPTAPVPRASFLGEKGIKGTNEKNSNAGGGAGYFSHSGKGGGNPSADLSFRGGARVSYMSNAPSSTTKASASVATAGMSPGNDVGNSMLGNLNRPSTLVNATSENTAAGLAGDANDTRQIAAERGFSKSRADSSKLSMGKRNESTRNDDRTHDESDENIDESEKSSKNQRVYKRGPNRSKSKRSYEALFEGEDDDDVNYDDDDVVNTPDAETRPSEKEVEEKTTIENGRSTTNMKPKSAAKRKAEPITSKVRTKTLKPANDSDTTGDENSASEGEDSDPDVKRNRKRRKFSGAASGDHVKMGTSTASGAQLMQVKESSAKSNDDTEDASPSPKKRIGPKSRTKKRRILTSDVCPSEQTMDLSAKAERTILLLEFKDEESDNETARASNAEESDSDSESDGPQEFDFCELCGKDSDVKGNKIVVCDGCNKGFHQKCHKPAVPNELLSEAYEDEDWFCSKKKCQMAYRNHVTRVVPDHSISA
ncbi:hypothetical protein SARC_01672 [Sphaeroforma arctica JP610]|uniref:PHD-type domain-containing protein n=1 Tax=Sphaeroforma arctica JP610 TaxID=667725 RepID=A0A0L0GB19_9EUKA|nr:hypothetical protein SARC_01672 [Sphaeroforma arctica JP610]KNC86195.1 hypothetical protein SARC_01672 [Sphaeroforma arctica JP610]|eukprot:XP_014160097.1 hypothetical protein SARC_01672 [Sphaeroforma arctica JP610]